MIALDHYLNRNSPIHCWAPPYKLLACTALITAFATVEDLRLVPMMLGITAGLYSLSRLPLAFLLSRLRYPSLFLIGVVGLLPFSSGETVLWQRGSLTLHQEGLLAAVLIACRFGAMLTTSLVLLATTPFLTLVRTLRTLGLPWILVDMLLLSYRYLTEASATLANMQQAMRLRGFGRRPRGWFGSQGCGWQQLASLTGTLLIRSYEQSEQVYKAMCLRGYGSRPQTAAVLCSWHWLKSQDAIALYGVLVLALSLILMGLLV